MLVETHEQKEARLVWLVEAAAEQLIFAPQFSLMAEAH